MAFFGSIMPIERPSISASNSPYTSPAGSRRSSASSLASAHTDPGQDVLDRLRQASEISQTSAKSAASSKSAFKSFFNKSKKPKEKKNYDKIVLTSRHAAAVKTKMMLDHKLQSKPKVKTAGISIYTKSAHLNAAAQEARHPHSGPPALHATDDMPCLTRIISGDERDEEDEYERNERLRWEWNASKQSSCIRVMEHESDESAQTSADVSADEGEVEVSSVSSPRSLSPPEPFQVAHTPRPLAITRNSYGTRFRKDEHGAWRR